MITKWILALFIFFYFIYSFFFLIEYKINLLLSFTTKQIHGLRVIV